ncbi:hypothetical protein ANCCAN_06422 [Ancylostoma caninum]|uniref:Uncharacterized protein n=1 Tax=Ancylostoma caninum TaxID=29170 RepID=A0A368GWW7_ANCCA|nr:hypothetical protein ANCCAN_06422 [Ancylostoma caninum]
MKSQHLEVKHLFQSIRKLCGWSTHFSFTCLLCISITGIYYLIGEIISITVGLSGLLVLQNFYLYRLYIELSLFAFHMFAMLSFALLTPRYVLH